MSARQPGENQNQLEAIIFLYHLQVQLARKQIRKRGSVAEEAEQEIQLTENNGVDECNEGKKSGPAKSARAKGKVVRLTFGWEREIRTCSHLCSANPSNLGTVPARRKRKPPHSQENAFENTHCSGSSVNSVDLASQCMSGQDKRNQNGLFKRTLVSNCSSLPEESCKAPQTLNTSADLRGSFFFKKYSGSVWWGHMGRL